jgi:hypothetical protein
MRRFISPREFLALRLLPMRFAFRMRAIDERAASRVRAWSK